MQLLRADVRSAELALLKKGRIGTPTFTKVSLDMEVGLRVILRGLLVPPVEVDPLCRLVPVSFTIWHSEFRSSLEGRDGDEESEKGDSQVCFKEK